MMDLNQARVCLPTGDPTGRHTPRRGFQKGAWRVIVYDEASEVSVKDGAVKIVGPDGTDVTLTPDAALKTSDRLWGQAMKARGDKILKN
jgi:hypothetical protein